MKRFLLLIVVSFASISLGQTLIDNPCNIPSPALAEFTPNAPCVNVSTAGMSPLFNPGSCNSAAVDDGWGWFVGTGNPMTVTFANPSADAILHVFSATAPCSVTPVGCSDVIGTGAAGTETVSFNSTLGTIYFIRIQRWNSFSTVTGCLGVTSTIPNPPATYTHPTTGINNEKVGACLVTDCGPFTYADDGDNGNYSNNVNTGGYSANNSPYRVFCPDLAGNCLQVTFHEFNTATGDYLWVRNGPTEFSPAFTAPPTQPTIGGVYDNALFGNLTSSTPFTLTSTDPSGCLTFNFLSNGSGTASGWYATIQCIPCAGGPNGTDNNDCINATPLCSTASVPGNSSGPGLEAEGCVYGQCPAGGENHTNWYTFTAFTSGTLNFQISPTTGTDDYDYAVYGPNVTCSNLGSPLRCSDSGMQGATGLTNVSPNENTEDVTGDGWTETMWINAGESYYLVIDEWSANAGSGYSLSFSGTATLDCTILPIELTEFNAYYHPETDEVELEWTTASERNSDYFEVERSLDGKNFEIIKTVPAVGDSDLETKYYMLDTDPAVGTNYYRLNSWDKDGSGKYSEVISVNILSDEYDLLDVFPNPTTGLTELIYNSYSTGESLLKVTSADGKTIILTPVSTTKGGNRLKLDLTGQERGVYLIEITTRDKSYRTKLLKD